MKINFIKKISNIGNEPEIFIISYPKTGRTWLRALIGYYLSEANNLDKDRVFDTDYIFSSSGLLGTIIDHNGAAMKLRKSYRQLDGNKDKYRNKKVLLLGRNIKDTLVSAYFQATKR